MRPLRDDATAVHHDDAVGLQDRGEAVRDDQRRSPLHQALERLLDRGFALRVEAGRRFVEQQHGRVLQDRAADRDALLLAAREAHAALAEIGVVAFRLRTEELVRFGGARGGVHLLDARLGLAEAQVVERARAEDHGVLRYERDRAAQLAERRRAQVGAVQRDAAGLRIVETQQQLEHGALAGAARADERDGFAGLDREREIVQRGRVRPRRVMENDVLERQPPAHGAERGRGTIGLLDRGLRREQLADALHRARGALHVAPHFGERADRSRRHHGVQHELAQHAGGERAREHALRADPEHERDRAEHEHDHECRQQRTRADAPACGRERAIHRVAEARALGGLAHVGLDGLDRVQRFRCDGAGIRDAVLALARQAAHAPTEQDHRQHHERDHERGIPRELRAGEDQQHRRADERDGAAHGDRRARAHHLLHELGVRGEARQHFARARRLEIAHVEAQQVVVQRLPQVRGDALAEHRDEEEARGRGEREHERNAEQRDEVAIDVRRVARREAVVDHLPHGERQHERRGRGQGQEHEPRAYQALVTGNVRKDRAQWREPLRAAGSLLRIVHARTVGAALAATGKTWGPRF